MADVMAEQFQVQFLSHQGIMLSLPDARNLRSAAVTLHRWDQRKCGFITKYPETSSVTLIRDEQTKIPYFLIHPFSRPDTIYERVEDRERAAEVLIQNICERYRLHFFRQTDPNESPFYLGRSPMTNQDYSTKGFGIGHNIIDKDQLFPQLSDLFTTWDMTP